ncbi:hypothetical protein TOPH_05105 [Tolypocladium ophioglossoides CBS 100239]|uniref:Uncharacterized protein n=1 Tax=Tolypocladium ophioglossoides (strain CBS 100239) TaxID=1163406 RepID=A0A0L0N887_TOLOC|nr:hypothetical protein TOPH_05105 [Tolypocladium ophioglossoides CBS 100239]
MPQPNLSVSTSNPDREPIPPPPVSPITPTLPPARLPDATPQQPLPPPATRPAYAHSQPDQVGIAPPPPEPIDFDSNPDVIALKSAISVLQVLSRVKDEALGDPEAFIRDLAAGKVNARGDAARHTADGYDDDNDDGDSGEDADENGKPRPKEWAALPQPQSIVRCPPINWSQYAVVGSSLDKLHAEQVSRPAQGTPASIGANGTYEFKGDGKQDRFPGVAAPYAPGKDRIEKKAKGRK